VTDKPTDRTTTVVPTENPRPAGAEQSPASLRQSWALSTWPRRECDVGRN